MGIQRIQDIVKGSIQVKEQILVDEELLLVVKEVAELCIKAFQADKKVFFCGNGGSAADAQHLAAEFSGRFYTDRAPLFAEALHVNSSYLTAVANDYSYEEVYSRLVKAKCRPGDILFGISTSGNSANIVRAFEVAKEQGAITVGMTGLSGGKMKAWSNHLINVPSEDTPRIQEAHIMLGHIICELTEKALF